MLSTKLGLFPDHRDGEDWILLSATHRVLRLSLRKMSGVFPPPSCQGQKTGLGHVFACLLWTVVIHLLWAWGCPRLRACRKGTPGAYEEGIAGMLTIIIKASLLGSALILLEGCTGYLTSYQTPCVEGHVCECVRYTTVNRSWLDCRDYGRVKSRAY